MLSRWPGLLTCINHPEAPGELHEVVATWTCRNFRARRMPVVRAEPLDQLAVQGRVLLQGDGQVGRDDRL